MSDKWDGPAPWPKHYYPPKSKAITGTATVKNVTDEYRIEGKTITAGWMLFDRVSDEPMARAFLGSWRKTRPGMKFRLKVVSTTTTERVIEEDT